MKLLSCIGAGLFLGASLAQTAVVINDGTTTDGLIRLAPPPTSGTQNTTLETTGEDNLLASVTQEFFDLPMHTAWYATAYVATGRTYSTSADFLPEASSEHLEGGVVAGLNEDTSHGLMFALRNEPDRTYCQVEVYDLSVGTRVPATLFDTNGVEADPSFSLASESPMNPGYAPENPLRLHVSFEPPTEDDQIALPGATARLTAVATQNDGSEDQAVTTPIVLLTTLPEPASGETLLGYYAVYRSILDRIGPIGRLDNLTVDGEFGVGNQLPTVTLTSPQDGQGFGSGDVIDITADATDPDGTIAQVEFFAGTQFLSVATQSPYAYTWDSAAIGVHTLSAVATDDRGATQTSEIISVEVTNRPPTVSITSPAHGQTFPPGTGVEIVAEASDPDGSVTQVQFFVDDGFLSGSTLPPYTTTWFAADEGTFTLTAVATDDRGASTTSDPVSVQIGQVVVEPAQMSVTVDGGQVNVTWDRTGFQLQYAFSLLGPWTNVDQDTTGVTQYSEPVSSQPKYYSLVASGVAPSRPTLAIGLSGNDLTIAWDQTGYQLQQSAELETGWQDVSTNTIGVSEFTTPISTAQGFFRLRP
jgi:hypothetical protein